MVTKIIKTEEDYNLTLDRINALMDAQPGTSEYDELELLSTLVELYEDQHYPIDLPDPVSALKFRMEQLGLTQKDLTVFLGSRSKVSEILNGKRNLSLSMIRSLHKELGIPSDILLQEPERYSTKTILQLDYTKFPLKEMMKKGWIPTIPHVIDHSEEVINNLIEKAGGVETVECCLFRRSKDFRNNIKNDPYALMAWSLKVLEYANNIKPVRLYQENSIDRELLTYLVKLSYFDNGPVMVKEYLEKQGIRLIILPHLKKTYLDGCVMIPSGKNPVIGLTLRYDRIDNFWFCLIHELAHLSLHFSILKNSCIVDDLDLVKYEHEDNLEKEADRLAQEVLFPSQYQSVLLESDSLYLQQSEIVKLAETLKIHPAIIAGRIRYQTKNYRKYSNLLGHGTVRKQFDTY